jgi:EF-hand domain pair
VVEFLGLRMSEEEVQALFDVFVLFLIELATVANFLGLRMSKEEVQAIFDVFAFF